MLQWIKDHLAWLLLPIVGVGAPKLWKWISGGAEGFLSVGAYLRARQKEYVKELELERDKLKIQNSMLIESHAQEVKKLAEDLETMTRAKDLREDISRQDRDTVRDLIRLCDEHKIDYSHIDVHIAPLPY